MSEQWTIYILVFGAVFLAVQGLRGVLATRKQTRRTAERFATIDNFAKNREEVELLKKRTALRGWPSALNRLNKLVIQSGTNLDGTKLLLIYAALFAVIYVLTWRLSSVAGLAISGTVPAVLLFLVLLRKRSRRMGKFGEQLPDVLDVVVRSLKAGHPLPVALSLVGREMPSPAGSEFMVAFEEISYGREVREALEGVYDRVGHPDLKFLITSIAIAHQTGGNLGEILSRLSKLIRERFRMKRKIKALSAEGRIGGYVLSAVPLVVFGAVSGLNPSYYAEFWGHSGQNTMLGLATFLLITGNIIIYKLVNFKV
ncbi:hypothetical protein DC522_04950 [Microvirga sp. KLBC 81]|uniref:type II secretion system F family protein n=1 Tax=Microvirga sp. KLBC 81 TaxID=1862707 RepID=UPI000D51BF5F|nr:type II secretion system F family protein [Microvirga sp. KLBC 81]PVE25666.1 hypothetical protein DC522_04950 [Microvirga sp. KLBC 81]